MLICLRLKPYQQEVRNGMKPRAAKTFDDQPLPEWLTQYLSAAEKDRMTSLGFNVASIAIKVPGQANQQSSSTSASVGGKQSQTPSVNKNVPALHPGVKIPPYTVEEVKQKAQARRMQREEARGTGGGEKIGAQSEKNNSDKMEVDEDDGIGDDSVFTGQDSSEEDKDRDDEDEDSEDCSDATSEEDFGSDIEAENAEYYAEFAVSDSRC